jgi:hypothetical protein
VASVVSQERMLEKQYGRIREVAEGIDGVIYFSTSNRDGRGTPTHDDDRILRLVAISDKAVIGCIFLASLRGRLWHTLCRLI